MPVIQHLGTAIGSGDDGLVLHLDASNSSSYPGSGSTWTDLSGQGNHVTLTGTTWSSSNGGYLIFDGNNDYGTVPAIDLTSTQFTLSIWTFIQDYNQTSSFIFLGDTNLSPGNGRMLNVHSIPYSGSSWYYDKGFDGTSYDRIAGSTVLSDYNNWTYWSFTANSSTGSMKMYRNGTLFSSGTGKTKPMGNANGDSRYIGRSISAYYDGYISKILMYKKELLASELLQQFNNDKAAYGL